MGSPVLKVDPAKIVGIVHTDSYDCVKPFTAPDEISWVEFTLPKRSASSAVFMAMTPIRRISLKAAFEFHNAFNETGDMRNADLGKYF